MSLKDCARAACPEPVLAAYRRLCVAVQRRRNASRGTADIFAEVYEKHLWGGGEGPYSGDGSRGPVAEAYIRTVREFIAEHRVGSVVDLGCGDFYVGQRLLSPGLTYAGVDVVPALIEHNQQRYGTDAVNFRRLDICRDDLPDGDLCLVRQVFQHLSNSQIAAALPRLRKYRHVLVTEHYPAPGAFTLPNADKPAGPDTRVVNGSAVVLDAVPFDVKVRLLLDLEVPGYLVRPGERIRTFLVEGWRP